MDEFQHSLPLDEPRSNLRAIEGGRAIAARNVQASFAVDTDDVATKTPNMAGYVTVAWDDEGHMTWVYHGGQRNPFSPAMIPEIVRNRLAHEIMGGAA